MAMPIYEYECLVCGALFDMRQSVGDPPPASCPAGHRSVRRRLSAPAIIFKGSGFYVTDHGRNGRSPTAIAGKPREPKESHEDGDKKGPDAPAGDGDKAKKSDPAASSD